MANFHLRNGAQLGGICYLGDPTPSGLRASAGLMVNYRYDLEHVARRNGAYVRNGAIEAAPDVARWLDDAYDEEPAAAAAATADALARAETALAVA